MKGQEFNPERLRIRGRLAWMQESDEGHWFTVPSSNDQVVFNENGIWAHSITGVRLPIVRFTDECYPFVCDWSPHVGGGFAAFSELLEYGEAIYRALRDSDVELYSTDPEAISAWLARNSILYHDSKFAILNPGEIKEALRIAKRAYTLRWREYEEERKLSGLPARQAREALRADRDKWMALPAYVDLFATVYGKSLNSLDDDEPRILLYYAHRLVEFRLKLGKWAPPSPCATGDGER